MKASSASVDTGLQGSKVIQIGKVIFSRISQWSMVCIEISKNDSLIFCDDF